MTLNHPTRPPRSVHYVPGSNARALEKAASLSADGLILDLEDAVLPGAKLAARSAVLEAVAGRHFRARTLRSQRARSPWARGDDCQWTRRRSPGRRAARALALRAAFAKQWR